MKGMKLLFASIVIVLGATSLQANANTSGIDAAPGHGGHGGWITMQVQQDGVSPLTGTDDHGVDTRLGNNR